MGLDLFPLTSGADICREREGGYMIVRYLEFKLESSVVSVRAKRSESNRVETYFVLRLCLDLLTRPVRFLPLYMMGTISKHGGAQ